MIQLGSLLHHQELADILGRALEDRLHPGDASRLKVLLNLNSYILRLYSSWFAERLFKNVLGEKIEKRQARTKGELKDLLVANPYYLTPRIEELIQRYKRYPDDYYRETPYEGVVFTTGNPARYVGSRRIKRIRRIAEKCARRIIDYMLEQIRRRADELAAERARSKGIQKEQLVTPPEEMVAEFQHAERRVQKSIRDGLFVAAMPQFYIDDVAGIRILTTPETASRVDDYLGSCSDLSIVDEKIFTGDFVGRNRVVAWRLPIGELLENPPTEAVNEVLISRGIVNNRSEIPKLYEEFLKTDSGHVHFEILTIDYEQVLESEIGRSMHEDHIRSQRDRIEYEGRLAQNVESLMVYLFAFAQSSHTELTELPIKLRGTYLQDYTQSLLRELFSPGAGFGGLTF